MTIQTKPRRVKPIRRGTKTGTVSLLALDTETTGLNLQHGCLPFFVSTCGEDGELTYWEWDVDPKTRLPDIPRKERAEIRRLILAPKTRLVFHNPKFDVRALMEAGIISFPEALRILEDCEDTLTASHCLLSAQSHSLRDLALQFLDIPDDDQSTLREEVNAARRVGRKKNWRIAEAFDPHWPHSKRPPHGVGWGAFDSWLPRAVALADEYPEDHPWFSVLQIYGIRDAERTIGLWLIFQDALEEEELWEHYSTRKKLLSITFRMEQTGITIKTGKLKKAINGFVEAEEKAERKCIRLADHKLDNPRSYKQLQGVLFGTFKLKPSKEFRTKTGYSTGNDALEEMKLAIKTSSRAFQFMESLQAFRKSGKAVDYLESYKRVSFSIEKATLEGKYFKFDKADWLRMLPNFNTTGTATTRLSSSDPNAQNISKQELFNLRQIFGPMPGRVWFALDYVNIELRIFAYQSGDQQLIDAFERGESVHLIFARQLYPELLDKLGPEEFTKTDQYRWVKNGDFALIYGAGVARTNATYRVPGAYQIIRKQLPLIDTFMDAKSREAKSKGYVTILGGYRLQVPKEKPYAAVNYFVQGSAGWILTLAMIRVDEYLQRLGEDYKLIMTVHDELVFDFPRRKGNLAKIRKIKRLMEQSGKDLGVPTPVDVDKIETDWANGKAVAV